MGRPPNPRRVTVYVVYRIHLDRSANAAGVLDPKEMVMGRLGIRPGMVEIAIGGGSMVVDLLQLKEAVDVLCMQKPPLVEAS